MIEKSYDFVKGAKYQKKMTIKLSKNLNKISKVGHVALFKLFQKRFFLEGGGRGVSSKEATNEVII